MVKKFFFILNDSVDSNLQLGELVAHSQMLINIIYVVVAHSIDGKTYKRLLQNIDAKQSSD